MEDSGQNQIFYMAYESILFMLCLGIIVLFWQMTTGVTNDLLPEVWDNSTISAESMSSGYTGVLIDALDEDDMDSSVITSTNGNIYRMSPDCRYNGVITGDQLVGEIMSIDPYTTTIKNIYAGRLDAAGGLKPIISTQKKLNGVSPSAYDEKHPDKYDFANALEEFQVAGSTLANDGSRYITGKREIQNIMESSDMYVRFYEYDNDGNIKNIYYILQDSITN